jgi:hypothetical protein
VAVQRSLLQTAVRTSHTVVGMLLFMTSVILLLRVLRTAAVTDRLSQTVDGRVALAARPPVFNRRPTRENTGGQAASATQHFAVDGRGHAIAWKKPFAALRKGAS